MSLAGEEVSPAAQVASAGAALAQGRARQNIEAEDICARLRISLTQVRALENDAYAKLPGPTFIRGIIRSYAKLLQIDAQPLLAAYERSATLPGTSSTIEVPTQNIRFTSGNGQPRNMRIGLVLLALVVVGGGALLWYTNPHLTVLGLVPNASPPPVAADGAAPQASPAPAAQTDATIVNPPAGGSDTQPGSGAAGVADATNPAFPPSPLGAAQEETTQPAPAKASEPTAAAGREAPLRFAFEQDSWVEVRDRSGKLIYSQIKQKGNEADVDGQPPFKIIIGNAAGVRLTYKGRSVDLAPRTKVNVARLTLE